MTKKRSISKKGSKPISLFPDSTKLIGKSQLSLMSMLIIVSMVPYFIWFLSQRFKPFETVVGESFFRGKFFALLLTPELFQQIWCGDRMTLSVVQVWPILKYTGITILVTFGLGDGVLRLLRLTSKLKCSEIFAFASAIGLSVLSVLLMVSYWLQIPESLFVFMLGAFVSFGICGICCRFTVCCFFSFFSRKRNMMSDQTTTLSAETLIPKIQIAALPSPWRIRYILSDGRWLFMLAVPSLLILLLGGMLPPVEYDVTSYHLPGAKQIFESGRIEFSANNVYTNMPFGVEMFYVWGMLLTSDWYIGALIGKLIIAYCSVITAIGLYAFGCHLGSKRAGQIIFVLYVSLPWVSWVSTAGLIDSVFGMYLLLALLAIYLCVRQNQAIPDIASLFVCGLMCGSAAACKYTAVPFLVVPLMIWLFGWLCYQRLKTQKEQLQVLRQSHAKQQMEIMTCKKNVSPVVMPMCCLLIGIVLTCGLWYVKNYWETGNPTYPLMYKLFGDSTGTWDMVKNTRWHVAHSSSSYAIAGLVHDFIGVLGGSDWLAPILIPLAILPFLRRKHDNTLLWLAGYAAFYLTLWWLTTHRLERFWVPLLPLITLFAGLGAIRFQEKIWVFFVVLLLLFNTCYTFFPNSLIAPGKYSRFGFGVEAARVDPARVKPLILYFNEHPPQGKILLIGDAEVFDYKVSVLYNTCWDDTLFDTIFIDSTRQPATLRSPEAIAQLLQEAKISHVVVNWNELTRFRSKGNYGYSSDFVQLEVFSRLTQYNLLQLIPELSTEGTHVYYTRYGKGIEAGMKK